MSNEALTLLIIWAVAVVAFFALWAILAKVVHRISERKHQKKEEIAQDQTDENPIQES
jgi:flagellar biosynthesis/type III secretory pathway M-ring protein FliF/YscJ